MNLLRGRGRGVERTAGRRHSRQRARAASASRPAREAPRRVQRPATPGVPSRPRYFTLAQQRVGRPPRRPDRIDRSSRTSRAGAPRTASAATPADRPATPRVAFGAHDLEHEVERGGERLGGQRQRIERLARHLGVREHAAREIQVRQRPLEHDGGPLQTPGACFTCARRPTSSSSRSRDTNQRHRPAARGFAGADEHGARRRQASSRSSAMPGSTSWMRWWRPGRQHVLGRHDVESLRPGRRASRS